MMEEKDHHDKTEKDNLQDKNARKEQYVINEKANISEVQTKEDELKLKVQELKDELEV